MKNWRALFAMAGLAWGVAVAGPAAAQTINVVTSFSVLGDVVKNVGGEHVNVTNLVPPNGDPHEFEPSPDNVRAVQGAAVTFISGEGLENWFERLARAAGSTQAPVVVSAGITTHTMDEDGKTVVDPHVWNSVPNVLIWVKNIEAALAKADPADAKAFAANAANYAAQLKALDADIRTQLAEVPRAQRKVLTSHDAFGYFGEAYGVDFLSPLGVSTETEASAADVAKLIDEIKHEGIKVYFLENSNDGRLIKQIADATGAQPGGELYPESLSDANGPVPSYVALMKYNTRKIVSAIKP